MRTNLVVRAVGIVILLAPWPIAAQEVETLSGSLPGWSVTPGISVGAGYDSNVALQNTPADTGQTVSDELILIQPTAQLDFLSPRTQFSSGYHGNVRRYFELDQLNGFDQQGYASLRRLASKRVTLAMSENYARTPTTDELELYGVPFLRTGARRNTFGGGVDTRLTKFMDLSVGVDHTWVAFDRTSSLLTGGWVAGGRVALSRRMREHLSVGGEYRLRFAEMNEDTRNLTFQDAGATVRIGLAQRTSVGAAVGLAFLNDRSLGEKRQGPYVPSRRDAEHGARDNRRRIRADICTVVRLRGLESERNGPRLRPHAARTEPDVCGGSPVLAPQRPIPERRVGSPDDHAALRRWILAGASPAARRRLRAQPPGHAGRWR